MEELKSKKLNIKYLEIIKNMIELMKIYASRSSAAASKVTDNSLSAEFIRQGNRPPYGSRSPGNPIATQQTTDVLDLKDTLKQNPDIIRSIITTHLLNFVITEYPTLISQITEEIMTALGFAKTDSTNSNILIIPVEYTKYFINTYSPGTAAVIINFIKNIIMSLLRKI